MTEEEEALLLALAPIRSDAESERCCLVDVLRAMMANLQQLEVRGDVDAVAAVEATVWWLLTVDVLQWAHIWSGNHEEGSVDLQAGIVEAAQVRIIQAGDREALANELDGFTLKTRVRR